LRLLPVTEPLYTQALNSSNPIKRFLPNQDVTFSVGWNFRLTQRRHVNNEGFVNDNDYSSADPRPLIAVIGDSYIESMHVKHSESVQGCLEAVVDSNARVYSFASSGTSLAGYLAYAEWARRKYGPELMVFVIVGNDFADSLFTFRQSACDYYFVPEGDGSLPLRRMDWQPSLKGKLWSQSALVRYITATARIDPRRVLGNHAEDSSKYVGNVPAEFDDQRKKLSEQAVSEYLRLLPVMSGLPPSRVILVVDGMRVPPYTHEQLEFAASSYFGTMRAYLLKNAAAAGFSTVDMHPVFTEHYRRTGETFEVPGDGHWNGIGHRLAAREIEATLPFREVSKQAAAKSRRAK